MSNEQSQQQPDPVIKSPITLNERARKENTIPQHIPEQTASTDEIEVLRNKEFTEPIEELIKLLSQSKRTFLIGAGCSKCAGLPLMEELTQKVLSRNAKRFI